MALERKKRRKTTDTERENEVVYTPPAPINRRQVILVIASIVAVALAVFLGLSVFFRVDKTKFSVHGNRLYRADTIWEAAGIKDGDSLLGLSKPKISSRIMQKLPYVKSVSVSVTLPDTVTIQVEELTVCLSVQDTAGNCWLMSADGKVVEKVSKTEAAKHVVVTGVSILPPEVGKKATASDQKGSSPLYTQADRLKALLSLATAAQQHEFLGDVHSVDVTDMNQITFIYSDRLEVRLGDADQMDRKIELVAGTIFEKLGDRDEGILYVRDENGIQTQFAPHKIQ